MSLSTCSSFKWQQLETTGGDHRRNSCHGVSVVLVGHKCVVFGGVHSLNEPKLHIFDTASHSWSSHNPQNSNLLVGNVKMSCVLDDTIFAYVWNHRDLVYTFVRLDLIEMASWTEVADINRPKGTFRAVGCLLEHRNEAAVTWVKKEFIRTALWHVESKVWRELEPTGELPKSNEKHGICACVNKVFVLGRPNGFKSFIVYCLNLSRYALRWDKIKAEGSASMLYSEYSLNRLEDRIIVYGGGLQVFLIKEDRWLDGVYFEGGKEHLNSGHGSVLVTDGMLVFGGKQPLSMPELISPGEH